MVERDIRGDRERERERERERACVLLGKVGCILLTVHPRVRLLVLDSISRIFSGVPNNDAATN